MTYAKSQRTYLENMPTLNSNKRLSSHLKTGHWSKYLNPVMMYSFRIWFTLKENKNNNTQSLEQEDEGG